MELKDILAKCDHTLLAQSATWEEIKAICDDGMKYATASVCIPASFVKQAKEYVGGKLAICTVIGEDKVFYLTFDCGYEMSYTPGILDVLKKYDVPAMFFVTQSFLTSHPDYVKRMKEEGHLVGNHTVKHLSMPEMTPEQIQNELNTVAKTMLELTGYEIDSFFRPPMGEYSKRTLQVTKDLGYKSIFWSIAYYDYDVNDQPGKEYVINHFKDYHHNGCIALVHNTSESNAQALEEVILLLLEEGYRFASLEELE